MNLYLKRRAMRCIPSWKMVGWLISVNCLSRVTSAAPGRLSTPLIRTSNRIKVQSSTVSVIKSIMDTVWWCILEKNHQSRVPEDWYKNFYHLDKYQVCKICGLRNPKTLSNWVMQRKLPKPVIAVGKRRWQSLRLFEVLQSTDGFSMWLVTLFESEKRIRTGAKWLVGGNLVSNCNIKPNYTI